MHRGRLENTHTNKTKHAGWFVDVASEKKSATTCRENIILDTRGTGYRGIHTHIHM